MNKFKLLNYIFIFLILVCSLSSLGYNVSIDMEDEYVSNEIVTAIASVKNPFEESKVVYLYTYLLSSGNSPVPLPTLSELNLNPGETVDITILESPVTFPGDYQLVVTISEDASANLLSPGDGLFAFVHQFNVSSILPDFFSDVYFCKCVVETCNPGCDNMEPTFIGDINKFYVRVDHNYDSYSLKTDCSGEQTITENVHFFKNELPFENCMLEIVFSYDNQNFSKYITDLFFVSEAPVFETIDAKEVAKEARDKFVSDEEYAEEVIANNEFEYSYEGDAELFSGLFSLVKIAIFALVCFVIYRIFFKK